MSEAEAVVIDAAATGDGEGDTTPGRRKAAATRQLLLDAARGVFVEQGFAESGIADVVRRAGASVGSLYHHFGGKNDLYLALYEDFADRQEARAAVAVRAARASGECDVWKQFLAGARAYISGCWTEHELSPLFLTGGGPPGFELAQRRRNRDWMRANARMLDLDDADLGEALMLVVTTVIGQAGQEVAVAPDADAAARLTDQVLLLLERMGRP